MKYQKIIKKSNEFKIIEKYNILILSTV